MDSPTKQGDIGPGGPGSMPQDHWAAPGGFTSLEAALQALSANVRWHLGVENVAGEGANPTRLTQCLAKLGASPPVGGERARNLASLPAEELARMFHEAYERLAPSHGYRTRDRSAVPWSEVPGDNRGLMIATAGAVMEGLREPATPQPRTCPSMKPGCRAKGCQDNWEWCASAGCQLAEPDPALPEDPPPHYVVDVDDFAPQGYGFNPRAVFPPQQAPGMQGAVDATHAHQRAVLASAPKDTREADKLRRALDEEHKWRQAAEGKAGHLRRLIDDDSTHLWMGDEHDDLASLCNDVTVRISAADLRGLVASVREPQAAELRKDIEDRDAIIGMLRDRLASKPTPLPEGGRVVSSVPFAGVGAVQGATYADETDEVDVWVWTDAGGFHIGATAEGGGDIVDFEPRGARPDVVSYVLSRTTEGM